MTPWPPTRGSRIRSPSLDSHGEGTRPRRPAGLAVGERPPPSSTAVDPADVVIVSRRVGIEREHLVVDEHVNAPTREVERGPFTFVVKVVPSQQLGGLVQQAIRAGGPRHLDGPRRTTIPDRQQQL